MKNRHMAAWAAKKAAKVAQQILDMPPARDWREAQRKAETCARLRREEARLRALALRYQDAA